jgi:hypothetical protein
MIFLQIFFSCVCLLLGFELRAAHYHLSHAPSPIYFSFYQIGSHVFAWSQPQNVIHLPMPLA